MKQEINRLDWNVLVVGEEGNKKILVPAIKEGEHRFNYIFNEDDMQVFEDLNGKQYAFVCELATKNSLDYFDRNDNLISTIFDYPKVLEKNGLKIKDRVSLETIKKLQDDINTLSKEDEQTL